MHTIFQRDAQDDFLIFDQRGHLFWSDFGLILIQEKLALVGCHSRLVLAHSRQFSLQSHNVVHEAQLLLLKSSSRLLQVGLQASICRVHGVNVRLFSLLLGLCNLELFVALIKHFLQLLQFVALLT